MHVSLKEKEDVVPTLLQAVRARRLGTGASFSCSMGLSKWADNAHRQSHIRTAYKITKGTLHDLLADLESKGFPPPMVDFHTKQGVWHVSC